MQRFSVQHQPRKDPEGEYGLIAEFERVVQENAKYKAFWDQSRLVDQMNFEEYVWKEEER